VSGRTHLLHTVHKKQIENLYQSGNPCNKTFYQAHAHLPHWSVLLRHKRKWNRWMELYGKAVWTYKRPSWPAKYAVSTCLAIAMVKYKTTLARLNNVNKKLLLFIKMSKTNIDITDRKWFSWCSIKNLFLNKNDVKWCQLLFETAIVSNNSTTDLDVSSYFLTNNFWSSHQKNVLFETKYLYHKSSSVQQKQRRFKIWQNFLIDKSLNFKKKVQHIRLKKISWSKKEWNVKKIVKTSNWDANLFRKQRQHL